MLQSLEVALATDASGCGGIGRRASFRYQWQQCRGSSSLPIRIFEVKNICFKIYLIFSIYGLCTRYLIFQYQKSKSGHMYNINKITGGIGQGGSPFHTNGSRFFQLRDNPPALISEACKVTEVKQQIRSCESSVVWEQSGLFLHIEVPSKFLLEIAVFPELSDAGCMNTCSFSALTRKEEIG